MQHCVLYANLKRLIVYVLCFVQCWFIWKEFGGKIMLEKFFYELSCGSLVMVFVDVI